MRWLTSLDTMHHFSWVDFKTTRKEVFFLYLKNIYRMEWGSLVVSLQLVVLFHHVTHGPWPISAYIRIKSLSKYKAFPV